MIAELPNLRSHYDTLSEFAHPNYAGMQNVYRVVDPKLWESRFRRQPFNDLIDLVDTALAAVDIGLGMSVVSVESYDREIEAFAALCEEAIQEGGTWPSSVPYPVKR